MTDHDSLDNLPTIKPTAPPRPPHDAPDADPPSLGDLPTEGGADAGALGRIDRYLLLRKLGGGGFGSVYLARDTVADIEVAVKGLPPLIKINPEELERVKNNFRLVQKLSHQNIAGLRVLHQAESVAYFDPDAELGLRVDRGDYLVVMEFAPGSTLSAWRHLFAEGKVPVETALDVCGRIAAALDYAHGQKIVHRDVKPSNVMVDVAGGIPASGENVARGNLSDLRRIPASHEKRPSGARGREAGMPPPTSLSVKVLDFGLAAEIRSSMSRVSNEGGDTSGTRPYMAPEQWAGRKQAAYTDQYALAVLFYELVSGAVPFASAFETGDPLVMARVAEEKTPEPLPELTKRQNAALLRGLAKDPADRFPSCGDFAAALGGGRFTAKAPRTRSGGGIWKWAAAALLLALLAVGGVVAHRSYQSRQARVAEQEAEAQRRKEQAALDAERQAQAAALAGEVRAALVAGDLKTAGGKLTELEAVVGSDSSLLRDLRTEYEGKAGERETNVRYAAASVARDAARELDRGQTFGAKLDALEMKWREAEAARQGRAWGQALSAYDAVLAQCKTLAELETSRQGAEAQRVGAESARRAAAADNAAEDASALLSNGEQALSRAAAAFEAGDFAAAGRDWQAAATAFAQSATRAKAVQAYARAKSAYETAFTQDKALLETHGGDRWLEALRQARIGEASVNDPTAGRAAYEAALGALPAAVSEARERERAAQVEAVATTLRGRLAQAEAAKAKADWDGALRILEPGRPGEPFAGAFGQEPLRGLLARLDALKTEAQAGQRAARIEGHLALARQAKQAGRWAEAVVAADKALAIDATHREAQALKREAEGNLVPTWRLVATVGEREVPATIRIGNQAHTAPRTFTLEESKRYTAEFSYEAGGRRYRADAVTVTADWKGELERRVALEEERGPTPGQAARVDDLGLELVWVAPGSFRMGSNDGDSDEKPVREVRISRGFWLGKFEVTQREYESIMSANPSNWKGDNLPVERVSWNDAVEFCRRLTERERRAGRLPDGYVYRLPTEAEWEYAARGGSQSRGYTYAGSNDIDEVAWYSSNSGRKTNPVGRKKPNELGLYDMSGNVWEWVHDWYQNSYSGLATTDPSGPAGTGSGRVRRGGGWGYDASCCRVAYRSNGTPSNTINDLGFRVSLAPPVQ